MKKLTLWAKNHSRWAIGFIVLLGIYEVALGIRIGRTMLPAVNESFLDLLVLMIVLAVIGIENNYKDKIPYLDKKQEIRLRQSTARAFFILTFVLSLIFGNILQQRLNPSEATVVAYTSEGTKTESQPASKKQLRKELRSYLKAHRKEMAKQKANNTTGLVVVGIILLLLGIGFGTGLVCAISCGSPALEIILYGLLTIGSFWGGIYLLNKAARIKRGGV